MQHIDGAPLSEHFSSLREKGLSFSEERIWKIFVQVTTTTTTSQLCWNDLLFKLLLLLLLLLLANFSGINIVQVKELSIFCHST